MSSDEKKCVVIRAGHWTPVRGAEWHGELRGDHLHPAGGSIFTAVARWFPLGFLKVSPRIDFYWVGSLDFKIFWKSRGFPQKPQKVKLFAEGSTATKKIVHHSEFPQEQTVILSEREYCTWKEMGSCCPTIHSIPSYWQIRLYADFSSYMQVYESCMCGLHSNSKDVCQWFQRVWLQMMSGTPFPCQENVGGHLAALTTGRGW